MDRILATAADGIRIVEYAWFQTVITIFFRTIVRLSFFHNLIRFAYIFALFSHIIASLPINIGSLLVSFQSIISILLINVR